ncbi:7,8-didemethyl-8-hydroxy-5-deazariboflavin synthase subunit CofG, partial [Haloferax volcanii]
EISQATENQAVSTEEVVSESGGAPAAAPDREWLRAPITDRLAADDVHGRRFRNVARGDGPLSIPR